MDNFLQTYTSLNHSNLHLLDTMYTDDVTFTDPIHSIKGLPALIAYFEVLYQNINSIEFRFTDPVREGDVGYVQWIMTFSHPKLKKGKLIDVPGASFLKFHHSDKVLFHHDHFDLGCMLYEHIPLFGKVISSIKKRVAT